MNGEQWREISGFPAYVVSNHGRVMRVSTQKVLRPKPISQHGYMSVNLCSNGKVHTFYVHRLVILTFVGDPPHPGYQVAHNNGNHLDNRLENLRWASRLENAADKFAHGRSGQGEQNSQAKLTEHSVKQIRVLSGEGVSHSEIAEMFGITPSYVWSLAKGKSWKHVA